MGRDALPDRLHGDTRSNLAVAVSTHAVGDDEQLVHGIDLEAVFVVAAEDSDIGESAGPSAQHQVPFPKRPLQPFFSPLRKSSSALVTTGSSPPQVLASL